MASFGKSAVFHPSLWADQMAKRLRTAQLRGLFDTDAPNLAARFTRQGIFMTSGLEALLCLVTDPDVIVTTYQFDLSTNVYRMVAVRRGDRVFEISTGSPVHIWQEKLASLLAE